MPAPDATQLPTHIEPTQGPYEIGPALPGFAHSIRIPSAAPGDYRVICHVTVGKSLEVAQANARLLAASWEMLQALKLARLFFERSREPGARACFDVMDPTIAKAEGR